MERRGLRSLLLLTALALLLIGGGLGLLAARGAATGRRVAVYALSGTGRQLVARFPLGGSSVGRRIRAKGPLGVTEIEIRGEAARVVSSPCRDKICVRFGWRRHEGESAACLPNRLLLIVEE